MAHGGTPGLLHWEGVPRKKPWLSSCAYAQRCLTCGFMHYGVVCSVLDLTCYSLLFYDIRFVKIFSKQKKKDLRLGGAPPRCGDRRRPHHRLRGTPWSVVFAIKKVCVCVLFSPHFFFNFLYFPIFLFFPFFLALRNYLSFAASLFALLLVWSFLSHFLFLPYT